MRILLNLSRLPISRIQRVPFLYCSTISSGIVLQHRLNNVEQFVVRIKVIMGLLYYVLMLVAELPQNCQPIKIHCKILQ